MVPGSLVAHNDTNPPTLEFQVYHFSAVQGGAIEREDSNALGCFITTVTAGTDMEWQAQILREFRDELLLNNSLGRKIVNLYYKNSTGVTNYLREHSSAKAAIMYALIPVSSAAYLSLHLNPVAFFFVVVLLLSVTVYCLRDFVIHPNTDD